MHKYALPIMDANGDLLSNTNHTDYDYNLQNLTLEISIEPVSLGLFRLYLMMDNSNKMMQHQWGFTQHDQDQIKGLFVDTPPLLTFATFAAAMLHSIFGVLAMKSDISFWYTKDGADSLKGLSTNSVTFECVSSFVITVYLIDSDQTNKIVIAFMIAECFLGLWKVQRIRNIKKQIEFKEKIADYEISDDESSESESSDDEPEQKVRSRKQKQKNKKKKDVRKQQKKKEAEEKKKKQEQGVDKVTEKTEGLDEKATRWMLMFMIPVVIGYAIYSFFYHKHKSVLSFIINVSASCVYGLGFIHLTPQLFINYELQSVDSLPWRVLIYRFFNTFVDDLFSFVIDMPLMHRLACFRDDIVFFVFLWQWYKYGSKKRKTD